MVRRFLPLLFLLASFLPARGAPPEAPLRLVGRVPLPGVEGRFDHFAIDVKGRRLFVAALGNDTVEVIDLKKSQVLRSIRGLKEPQGVAYAPDLDRIFIGNGQGNNCTILDGTKLTPVATVPDLADADNVRYDPAAREAFVGYGNGLAVLDAAAGKLLARIPLAAHAESFQLEKDGPRLFVNVPGAGHVAVVDRKKRRVTATWPLHGAGANYPMALDEPDHRLLIGCRRPARMLVFDTRAGKQAASAEIAGDADDLFYDAGRKRVYVAGGEGRITVLAQRDADHYEKLGDVATAPGARTGFFSAELDRFYLAVPHRGSQVAEIRIYAPAGE